MCRPLHKVCSMSVLDNRKKDIEFENIFKDSETRLDFESAKELFKDLDILFGTDDRSKQTADLLYKVGRFVFGSFAKYPKEDIHHQITFPGSHDFNMGLSRKFEEGYSFYRKWTNNVRCFIESQGTVYPRYFPEFNVHRKLSYVSNNILLFRNDMPDGKMYDKTNTPAYWSMAPECADKELQMKICKQIFPETADESYGRYMEKDYPVYKRLQDNMSDYMSMPKTIDIKSYES